MAGTETKEHSDLYDGQVSIDVVARSWDLLREAKSSSPESPATAVSAGLASSSPRAAASAGTDRRLHVTAGSVDHVGVADADAYMSHVLPSAASKATLHSHWRLALYFTEVAPDTDAAGAHWDKAAAFFPPDILAALAAGPGSMAPAEGASTTDTARAALVIPATLLLFRAQYAEYLYTHRKDVDVAHAILAQVMAWDPKQAAALGTAAVLAHRGQGDAREAGR